MGNQCDPYFIQEIFKTSDFSHIDKHISEEEIFAGYEQSAYLQGLFGIVNSFRYQRQPYCEIKVLLDGDSESEAALRGMMITDNMNVGYPMDFQKFLGTITGGGSIAASTTAGPANAYY